MNLRDMTVPQLREIAAEHYVNGRSKMKKADLIEAIESHRRAEQERVAERDAYLKMNDADREQAQADMIERNRPKGGDEVDLSGIATMLGRDVFGTVEEQAAYIEDGIAIDEADDAEQLDRTSYYSGAVPCFERTTVDGIGYGCVKIGEHVEHNTALGAAWWVAAEQANTGKIAITKYSGHEAIATAVFGTDSIAGHVTRHGGRWELRDGVRKIRAKTLGKVAKQWAKALAFHATTIDVETMS